MSLQQSEKSNGPVRSPQSCMNASCAPGVRPMELSGLGKDSGVSSLTLHFAAIRALRFGAVCSAMMGQLRLLKMEFMMEIELNCELWPARAQE